MEFEVILIGNSSLKWSTIPALNGRPFKAGIANQIFNLVYLYSSCWMGGWWYGSGSDHNDLLYSTYSSQPSCSVKFPNKPGKITRLVLVRILVEENPPGKYICEIKSIGQT